jgi:hypothetical protein
MTNPNIRIKRSAIPGKRPSNSQMELGELALNTNDGRLFTKKENVGIGTTVTLLNVWTENVGGGAYYTDGNIGIGITNAITGLTINGKISTGDEIDNPNIASVLNVNVGTGIAGNRPINLIDSAAGIKIARITDNLNNDSTIEFQTWNSGITTNTSYWDVYGGFYGMALRDRFTNRVANRLFVDTNGNILIGSTSGSPINSSIEVRNNNLSNIFQVQGNSYFSGDLGIGTTNPTSKLTVQGDVLVSGVITSTDYNSASDINLKENIQPIENPIDKVLNITGVSFDWKEDGRSSMGVIAQEVERVLPELVSGSDSKTVNYNGLIGLLIEVVKEQQREINTLKEKIK